ncbi:hypothetical protein SFRURICE_020715 [Spodoptera frugiperda]|nr:hypothetical protein SFRURICE_020715 [Spodoptera frugiperda]
MLTAVSFVWSLFTTECMLKGSVNSEYLCASNHAVILIYYTLLVANRLPRWLSGCKSDCRARGLGFVSRVGRSIAGLFSHFRKFLSSSTESGNVPDCIAALRVVMSTSAYPFGYKRRDVASFISLIINLRVVSVVETCTIPTTNYSPLKVDILKDL